jgi:hypothetical protein
MQAQLEWEIEDVDAPLPDDPQAGARRPHGCRRWWPLLILTALVIAVGLVFLSFRLREKQKELEIELRAVVELELNALANGDRDLFLNLQDPNDRRWRRAQTQAFDTYQRRAGRAPWDEVPLVPEYTGHVPNLHVHETDDEGWAQVQVTRGDQTWRELWFYRWTQANGWRRVRFDSDWLGKEQALTTSHLRFTYPQRDAAIVTALAHEMEDWCDILAPILGLRPTSTTVLTVKFVYRAPFAFSLQPRWVKTRATLEAPSPHQSPLAGDGTPAPELRALMAHYLVEALIDHQSGEHTITELGPTVSALRAELRDWSVTQLTSAAPEPINPDVPATPLVSALIAGGGVGRLPALAASLDRPQTLDEVLAAAGLDPPDAVTRLAFHVAALNRALHDLDETRYRVLVDPQADSAWQQNQISRLSDRRQTAQAGHLWPVPSSLQVTSLVFNNPFAWVATETRTHDGAVRTQTFFFRQFEDQWLLTAPDPAYLGKRRETRTENLVFEYYEPDAPWFEEKIPNELQALLDQAAADLGITTDGLLITVATDIVPGASASRSEETARLRFASPSIAGWRVDQPDPQEPRLAIEILGMLLQTRLSMSEEGDFRAMITHVGAFLWEIERLFPQQIDWDAWLGVGIGPAPAQGLDELWEMPNLESEDSSDMRISAGYRALFEFLTETYGPQVVPALLDNVSKTDDLDEWLRQSTGHGLDEVEPAWQRWVADYYQE